MLSNKKDAYYVVTPKACSCPAAAYHPGQPCKHQRKFFPPAKRPQSNAMLASQHGLKSSLCRQRKDIRGIMVLDSSLSCQCQRWPDMVASEEIRQALLELAYEPEAINLDALVTDVIEIARRESIPCTMQDA